MINYIPSQNIAAEKQILGWMILKCDFKDVDDNMFFDAENRNLYRAMREQWLKDGEINPFIIEKHTQLISECQELYFPSDISQTIEELLKLARHRKYCAVMMSKIGEIENQDADIDDLLKNTREELAQIGSSSLVDNYDHAKSVYDWMVHIDDRRKSGEELRGYRSGLKEIDTVLSGWQPGLSYVIGGLKKTGKSRFALFLASQWMVDGLGGIVFSLEMSPWQIHGCVVGERTKTNTALFGTNRISEQQTHAMRKEISDRYMQDNFYICSKSGISPSEVRAFIQKRKIKSRVDFVIVDYIQRMHVAGAESRAKEVERCANGLADIARDEKVIMVVVSQLSAEAEKIAFTSQGGGKKVHAPIYAFFKESGAIIEACDAAIALVDPARGSPFDTEADSKELEAIILQREGATDVFIKVNAQLQYSHFRSAYSGFDVGPGGEQQEWKESFFQQ